MKRRRINALGLFLAITTTGLLWRFAPLHLPYFAWKYGGSMLWAAGLYWLLAAAAPRLRPTPLALLTAVLAALVEFSRLLHTPWLDHFRHTLAGKLTLGQRLLPTEYRGVLGGCWGCGLARQARKKYTLALKGHGFSRAVIAAPRRATSLPKAGVKAQPERLNCFPSPGLDHFRHTLASKLTLGSVFAYEYRFQF